MAIPERVDLFRVQVRRGKDRGNENNGKRRRSESGQVREKGGGCEGRDERDQQMSDQSASFFLLSPKCEHKPLYLI